MWKELLPDVFSPIATWSGVRVQEARGCLPMAQYFCVWPPVSLPGAGVVQDEKAHIHPPYWIRILPADRVTENVMCPQLSPWLVDVTRQPRQSWIFELLPRCAVQIKPWCSNCIAASLPLKPRPRTLHHICTIDLTLKLTALDACLVWRQLLLEVVIQTGLGRELYFVPIFSIGTFTEPH